MVETKNRAKIGQKLVFNLVKKKSPKIIEKSSLTKL